LSFLFFPSTDWASDGHLTFSLGDFTTHVFDFFFDDAETLPFKINESIQKGGIVYSIVMKTLCSSKRETFVKN
jgi:hypothetical protein